MQPHDKGPRRKQSRHEERCSVKRMTARELADEAERLLAISASALREAGFELFQVSICGECGFVGSGFYQGCGNHGHATANAEISEETLRIMTSIWN